MKKIFGLVVVAVSGLGCLGALVNGVSIYGALGAAVWLAVGYLGYYFLLKDKSGDKPPY